MAGVKELGAPFAFRVSGSRITGALDGPSSIARGNRDPGVASVVRHFAVERRSLHVGLSLLIYSSVASQQPMEPKPSRSAERCWRFIRISVSAKACGESPSRPGRDVVALP